MAGWSVRCVLSRQIGMQAGWHVGCLACGQVDKATCILMYIYIDIYLIRLPIEACVRSLVRPFEHLFMCSFVCALACLHLRSFVGLCVFWLECLYACLSVCLLFEYWLDGLMA